MSEPRSQASPGDTVTWRPGPGRVRPPGRRGLREQPAAVLVTISCGGALGALGRYGLSTEFPHPSSGMPWATLGINVSGCLLIGVLMVVLTDAVPNERLLRPFLGVGVLGGYTTFSTYTADIQQALTAGAVPVALIYLGLTLALAMVGVVTGSALAQALLRHIGREGSGS